MLDEQEYELGDLNIVHLNYRLSLGCDDQAVLAPWGAFRSHAETP